MRKGFTLLELIFVILIFGILSKFGADILYKIYENYIYSNTYNKMLNQSENAVIQIANRLQYRIKDSTIARDGIGGAIEPIGSNTGNEKVLEWIGTDIDGWKGTNTNKPDWSGFIDLANSTPAALSSPGTSAMNGDLALFFIGSDVDLTGNNFGWNGVAIADQNKAMHRVNVADNTVTAAVGGDFTGVDVFEFYQMAKSAFAVSMETDGKKITLPDGSTLPSYNLFLYYGYQPWSGEKAGVDGIKSLLSEDVLSFKFTSMGDILIVQVCTHDNEVTFSDEGYAVCKEKVVF